MQQRVGDLLGVEEGPRGRTHRGVCACAQPWVNCPGHTGARMGSEVVCDRDQRGRYLRTAKSGKYSSLTHRQEGGRRRGKGGGSGMLQGATFASSGGLLMICLQEKVWTFFCGAATFQRSMFRRVSARVYLRPTREGRVYPRVYLRPTREGRVYPGCTCGQPGKGGCTPGCTCGQPGRGRGGCTDWHWPPETPVGYAY